MRWKEVHDKKLEEATKIQIRFSAKKDNPLDRAIVAEKRAHHCMQCCSVKDIEIEEIAQKQFLV
jgi:hypothetical protein